MSEEVPHYGPMTEERVHQLLEKAFQSGEFFRWPAYRDDPTRIQLDGEFSAEQLEAIAWWMRNKPSTPGLES